MRYTAALTAVVLAAATVVAVPATGHAVDAADGPRVVAADGTTHVIDAIDPSNRVAGILGLYTPEFGATTGTNQFGAEAVLEPGGEEPGHYVVTDVCTVWDSLAAVCGNPGDNPIPRDGYVLSASPAGVDGADPRTFLRDHVAIGDVVSIDLPILREAVTTLDAIDPTAATNPDGVDASSGECFPGCRGADQMIQYTPASGEATGTNQFGYEVVVVDDRVIARGGADNPIPPDGSVLSGHGSRGNWLATNATIGALVDIEGDQLRVRVDAGSYLFGAQQAIDRAEQDLAVATDACLSIDGDTATSWLSSAAAQLAAAEAATADGDDAVAVDFAQTAGSSAEQAWYATRTSRALETRGVWVRPEEESPEAIAETVIDIAAAGFTTIYLETFFQGYTIFPSEVADAHGVTPQRPQFDHFDPLQVWLDEAHAHGLELHPWVHSFFVGNDALGGPGPILEVHPDWAAVEYGDVGEDMPRPSTAEAGYYFVDPSIPEARDYLHGVFDEIVSGYAVDGLHLDYIRYPISLPLEVSFSYSDHARAEFEVLHHVDPYELTPADAGWEDWNDWRSEQITSFVAETHDRLGDADRDVVLSAAVFPDRFDAEERKLQDWAGWSQAGIIDLLAGMSFGGSPERNALDTVTMLDATSEHTLIVTGIYSPFNSLPADTMLDQIDAVRDVGAHGVALFAYNQLDARQAAALEAGPFRESAVSADRDQVSSAMAGLTDLAERTTGVHAACLDTGVERASDQRLRQIVGSLERLERGRGDGEAARQQAVRHLDGLASFLDGRVGPEPLADQYREELGRARDVLRSTTIR